MDAFLNRVAVCLAAACLLVSSRAPAFERPGHTHELPDLDKRREAPASSLAPGKLAAANKLRSQVRGLRIEHDGLLQTPRHVFSTTGFLSGPDGEGVAITAAAARPLPVNDRHRAVKAFLNEHRPLFGHGAEAIERARLRRDVVARHNGLRTAVWEQRMDDIAVYEGVLVGHVTRRGELAALSSQFISEPERAADSGTPNRAALQETPVISAAQAVWLAAESIEEKIDLAGITPLDAQAEGLEKRQFFRAAPLPGEAQVRLIWLPMNAENLRLCWEVELTRRAGGERYRVLLDARTGEVQLRRRLTVYLSEATYRVFTSDSPSPFSPGWPAPASNQPPTVARSLVTLSALNTNASPIGWISDGENETRGNNVDAHADLNADDTPDLPRPQGSPFRVFDPPLDLAQSPGSYTDAAVVQLFYWCNWAHDRLYELGFDEAAGNFQKDNFGRGGLGGDAIHADAQDGSGFNNANFTPAPDGSPPRIQMFVFNGPEPDIDGDLDAEVILHEYVHGLTTRLVGGGVGYGTLQTAGMGEGWSDFYAMAMLSEPADDLDAAYPFGAYASTLLAGLTENYYFGIRRYPYSTDLGKNPLTFKDIDPSQASPHFGVPMNPIYGGFNPIDAAEVHAMGEVWCVALWEARAALVRKHGYPSGNQLILQLVTDGLKLAPINPNFLQARDGIILADQINNQGANYGDLWRAFAKRGMGFSAFSPDTGGTAGLVEAFDLPDSLFLINPAGFVSGGPPAGPLNPTCQNYPLTNISEQTISWTVRVTQPWLAASPAGGTLAPGAATNVTVCLTAGAQSLPLGTFKDTIYFSNTVSGVVQQRSAEVRVAGFTSMPFAEDFERRELGTYWSVSGSPAQRTEISTLNGPRGSNHLILDSIAGIRSRNELTLGIDLGGYTNVFLSFWTKSFSDEPDGPPPSPFRVGADFDGVAISQDGIMWYEVQSLRGAPVEYTNYVVDLDAAAARHGLLYNATFRIRFNHVDDFQVPFDGLGLDDITIQGTAARRLAVNLPEKTREGDGLLAGRGAVVLGVMAAEAIHVALSSSDPAKVAVPASVVIPAGSDRAAIDLTILDNAVLDGTVSVMICAEAVGYFAGGATLAVTDNETATLTVRLPENVREGESRKSKRGVVRTSARPQRDVELQLRSSDEDELEVPATVVLRAGRSRVEFELMPVDDLRIDGPRRVTVTAHVENWSGGRDTTWVLDNDDPELFIALPVSASEGNGVLTNGGVIRLSGTLPTNLVVALSSSDRTELRVPASATVPAGQFEAAFDLTVIDDSQIDGERRVTVTASAPGFNRRTAPRDGKRDGKYDKREDHKHGDKDPRGTTATMSVLDDETPPIAFRPQPPNGATNVPVLVSLSWNPGIGEILVNGGFETGDFTGWTTVNGGYGAWVINDGTVDPTGPEGTNAPLSGKFSAMITQIGGGEHLLYQDVFIPPDAQAAEWSWWDRIRNHGDYYSASQFFRAEVRDTNGAVLATAFTTQFGDPLLNDWQQRSFDLTAFRGRVVRLAFHEQDSTDYFNVLLDDVSVRLGEPEVPTTHDVYFGTRPTPGAAEFLGNTTNSFWTLPSLALNTTYYWRIDARRGAATARGPVWRFTTRGVGEVHHFEWGPIASPQFIGQRFAATLTARADIGNTVRDFNEPVEVMGLAAGAAGVVISEVDVAASDRVEFANVSQAVVDVSDWKISVYDAPSWPAPLTTVTVPKGSHVAPGGVFVLNDSGVAPGQFPSLNAGTNVTWNNSGVGNPIAVVLRDATGNFVDVMCAGNADPALITAPARIPAEEWSGLPVFAALPLASLTMQRVGDRDGNGAGDWEEGTASFGSFNEGLSRPFMLRLFEVEPSTLTNFVTGVWSGYVTVREPSARLVLHAVDGAGRRGEANEIAVGVRNDVAVAVADVPDVVLLGNELTYRVTVTNSGPDRATGLVLTNLLPAEVNFLSYATFNGVCSNAGNLVVCALDNLSAGDSARISIVTRAATAGVFTNFASIVRAGPDGYAPNNATLAVTTVTGPSIATTNLNLTEGNSGTNLARIPVRLSAPCALPVSVAYATSNSTAVAGEDFVAASGVLVFQPGVTSMNITVPVLADTLDEIIESFFVDLSSPTNGFVAGGQSRCRIMDDDFPPALSINDVTLTEGASGTTNYAEFAVRLSAPSGLAVAAGFSTADRGAVAAADYVMTFGTLNFQPGATQQIVRVPVLGDNRFEPTETFVVTLTNFAGASLSRSLGTATILDDDDDELDRFVWSLVPSPQFVGLPFVATLSARDGLDRLATGFSGQVTVRGVADSQEIVVGAGTNEWEFPLGTLYHDARTQVIYTPEELGGPGKINALSLQIVNPPGQTLSNWTIRLKHTPVRSHAQAAWESTGWTTAYRNDETVQSTGWVTFLFAAPFDYDGTNSLLVDFSFNNSTYSVNGFCRSTAGSPRRTLYFQTDSAFGDPLEWNSATAPPPLTSGRVPNARFLIETPVEMMPSGQVQVSAGVWSGPVTVHEPATDMFLRASDTAGRIANGNLFTVESSDDSDTDGLPDAWETRYFGTVAALPNADSDNDGLNNAEEFRAGTNPTEAASSLSIRAVQMRGSDVVIRFESVGGKLYRLERAPGLSGQEWPVVIEQIPGTGGTMEVVVSGAAGANSFYRLKVGP